MIGAGTVINPIIKVVTTVAILAAVYLFFVKPALDTTNNITDRAFDQADKSQKSVNGGGGKNDIQKQIQKQIRDTKRALKQSGANAP